MKLKKAVSYNASCNKENLLKINFKCFKKHSKIILKIKIYSINVKDILSLLHLLEYKENNIKYQKNLKKLKNMI